MLYNVPNEALMEKLWWIPTTLSISQQTPRPKWSVYRDPEAFPGYVGGAGSVVERSEREDETCTVRGEYHLPLECHHEIPSLPPRGKP